MLFASMKRECDRAVTLDCQKNLPQFPTVHVSRALKVHHGHNDNGASQRKCTIIMVTMEPANACAPSVINAERIQPKEQLKHHESIIMSRDLH